MAVGCPLCRQATTVFQLPTAPSKESEDHELLCFSDWPKKDGIPAEQVPNCEPEMGACDRCAQFRVLYRRRKSKPLKTIPTSVLMDGFYGLDPTSKARAPVLGEPIRTLHENEEISIRSRLREVDDCLNNIVIRLRKAYGCVAYSFGTQSELIKSIERNLNDVEAAQSQCKELRKLLPSPGQ